jgi:predicted TIM-barrel fold metal-dependent hydrolase
MQIRLTPKRMRHSLAAAILSALWLLPVAPAQAQTQGAAPSPAPAEQSRNIPDQKLDAAAKALENVASLKQNYQDRLAGAAPADKEKIAEEGNNALAKAVTDQGLSVEEYTSIMQVAQSDPEIRQKILQRLK